MPVRQLLAKIHIAKKELNLSEDEYRDILEGETGKRSSAKMTTDEVGKCIKHFIGMGWMPKTKPRKYKDSPRDIYDSSGAAKRKAEAMWETYHHDHCKCDDSKGHGRRFLFSRFRISDWTFLDKRTNYDVIEALKAMQKRRTPWSTEPDSTGQGRTPVE